LIQAEKDQQDENNLQIMTEIYQKKLDIAKIDIVLSQLSKQNISDMNKNQAAVNSYRQSLISLGISKAKLATVFTESGGNTFINEERLKSLQRDIAGMQKNSQKKADKVKPVSFRTKLNSPKAKDMIDTRNIAQKWVEDHPITLPFMIDQKQAPIELLERRVQEFQKKLDSKTKGKLDLLGEVDIKSYQDFEKIIKKISEEFGMTEAAAQKLFDLKPRNAQEILEYENSFKLIKGEVSLTSDKIKEFEKNIEEIQVKLEKQKDLNERGVFSKVYEDLEDIARQNPGGTTDTLLNELSKQQQALREHQQELKTISQQNYNNEKEAMLREKDIYEEKLKTIRDYNKKKGKERSEFDELTGGASQFQKQMYKVSDSMKNFQNLTKDSGNTLVDVFTDPKVGTAFINMIDAMAQAAKQAVEPLFELWDKFAENLTAKADLMKVKMQNVMNTLNAFSHYEQKRIDQERGCSNFLIKQKLKTKNNYKLH